MEYVNKGKFAFTDPDTGVTYEPGEVTQSKPSGWLDAQELAGVIIKKADEKQTEPEKELPKNTTNSTLEGKSATTPNTAASKPAGRANDSAGQPTQ